MKNCDNKKKWLDRNLRGLRNFCVQEFPFISEDFDALTTYELLSKVICYLKTIGEAQEELIQAFDDLVNEVDEKVDEKLDEVDEKLDIDWVKYVGDAIQKLYDEGTLQILVDQILNGLSDIVYVNSWGAKGDGVTDDTLAVQRCFDLNQEATFIFHGVYKITDTITLPNATRNIQLANMVWGGARNKAMFKLTNAYYPDLNDVGGTVFNGGVIQGTDNNPLDCGIWVDTFSVKINNTRVKNYKTYGILVAHTWDNWVSSDNKSTGLQLSNVQITNYPNAIGTAIALVHTDNIISNCNFNGCDIGVGYYGGNLFVSNTHITPTTNTTTPADHCIANINPIIVGSVMELCFTGCYFNGVPLKTFRVPNDTSHIVNITGGAIIYGSNVPTGTRYDLVNDSSTRISINLNNVTVRISPNTFFNGFTDFTGAVVELIKKPDKILPSFSNKITTESIFDLRNLRNNWAEAVPVTNSNHPLKAGYMRKIGAIVYQYSGQLGRITLGRAASAQRDYLLNFYSRYLTFSNGVTVLGLYIDTATQHDNINGLDVDYKNIYLVNSSDDTDIDNVTIVKAESCYPGILLFINPLNSDSDVPILGLPTDIEPF